jgi:hypothetical protein
MNGVLEWFLTFDAILFGIILFGYIVGSLIKECRGKDEDSK